MNKYFSFFFFFSPQNGPQVIASFPARCGGAPVVAPRNSNAAVLLKSDSTDVLQVLLMA